MERLNGFRDILSNFKERKNKTAFIFKNSIGTFEEKTYEEFLNDCENLGKALIKRGYYKSKIALCGKNSYEWCLCYLAITCFVGTVVPLDKELSSEELGNIVDFAQPKAVIVDGKVREKLNEKNGKKEIFSFESDISSLLKEGEKLKINPYEKEINEEEMSVLLFTSGTTGMMKGVMLSQRNICSDLISVNYCAQITSADRALSFLPLHHTYEAIVFLMIMYKGASVAFSKGIRYLREEFSEFRPTIFVCVPLVIEKLYSAIVKGLEEKTGRTKSRLITGLSGIISEDSKKRIFSDIHLFFGGRLEKIVVGAAPLDEDIAKSIMSFGFKLILGYGLTECSPIVICNNTNELTYDSVGKPLPGVEIKLLERDKNGIGEIAVKGPMVMLGYYKNEKATNDAFYKDFFLTGDLAYKDKKGFYHITGRKKNMILGKNGKNIYPEELEYYLLKSPKIREVLVFEGKGGIISAEILPDLSFIAKKLKKNEDELRDSEIKKSVTEAVRGVNRLLPSYKNIRNVEIRTTEFKKTTTHKIKR